MSHRRQSVRPRDPALAQSRGRPPRRSANAEAARRREQRIAALASLAIVIHIVEGLLPSPIPGVKPGLANVITLLAWQCFGLQVAVAVTVLRVTVGSLMLGSLFGPGFWLAASGAVAALATLAALAAVPDRHIGVIGRSSAMALAHVSAQLWLAMVWLLPGTGLLELWAPLAAAALLTGLATGLVAARLLRAGGCGTPCAHDRPAAADHSGARR